MKIKLTAISMALLVAATSVQAAIVGVGGASVLVSAPADANLNQYTHPTEVRVWNELQRMLLTQNVIADAVAPGLYNMSSDLTNVTINAGTLVDSHYVHFDTPGSTAGNAEGSVTFDRVILGVIVRGDDSSFTRLDDSDFLAGSTIHDNGLNARGLEFNTQGTADRFAISADGKTVSYKFGITEPGDRFRVITQAVPEPATMAMLGIGALGLLRKRRK